MNDQETIQDYCYDEAAFDYHDRAYIPLQVADAPEQPLRIPEILKPDQETATDVYYTITAQTGTVQLLPGKKTATWGYNGPLLGKTVIFKDGQTVHIHYINDLPE
ncbi:multicopper oxidase domain-containing protein, partial [Bifidobacterium longum]|nr:multicopper oxidase domain-containing protein [Bifidobacterium longum]